MALLTSQPDPEHGYSMSENENLRPFHILRDFIDKLDGCVIEIGSDRGEGSTPFLADLCSQRSRNFYTVDIDEVRYRQSVLLPSLPKGHVFKCSGEEFAANYWEWVGEPISFVFLDNYDWMYPEIYELPKEEFDIRWKPMLDSYAEHFDGHSNHKSQIAHLQQTVLLEKYGTDHCYFLFDDTWTIKDSTYTGKGGAAIVYLETLGFQVLKTHFYGKLATLMVRESKKKVRLSEKMANLSQSIELFFKKSF